MNRRPWLTHALLGAAVVLSGVVVVKTKHENRTLVHELEQLRAEKARLETEWAQLQLEEATLANHGRIDRLAREKLGMTEPSGAAVAPPAPAAPGASAGDRNSFSMTPAGSSQ